MEFSKIIIKPMHTEKSYAQQSLEPKRHAFIVDINASKYDIKLAFESIYGFTPTRVTTQIRKPANIRTGTNRPGMTKKTKIAYITLPKGVSIAAEDSNDASSKSTEQPKEDKVIK